MGKEDIYKNICQRIKYYLDQNKIDPKRYSFKLTNSSLYNIEATHTYTFKVRNDVKTRAGGKASNYDYSNEKDFINNQNKLLNYASNPLKEKETYIKDRINNPIDSLSKKHVSTIWESAQISYRYQCSTCYGSGSLTCSNCNGSGEDTCFFCSGTGRSSCSICGGTGSRYETETYYENGTSYSRNVLRSCYSCGGAGRQRCSSCGGSGEVTCSTCYGSGKVTCHSCSGHGFFRKYCTVYAEAHKETIFHYNDKNLYISPIVDLLKNNGTAFYIKNFNPSLISHQWGDAGKYILRFSAPAQVVEATITLDNKINYKEAGVNNINSLIYPHIFDYFLEPFVEMYYTNNTGWINFLKYKTPLKEYFNYRNYKKLKENPTFSYAFEVYPSMKDAEPTERIWGISSRTGEYMGNLISPRSSWAVSNLSVDTLSSVAPHTTKTVWLVTYLLTILIESYFTYEAFHGFTVKGFNTAGVVVALAITSFAYVSLVCAITFGFIAPLAVMANKIVTRTRQMAAEKQHRSKIYHKKHLRKLFKINIWTFIFFMSGMYLYKKIIQPDAGIDNTINNSVVGTYLANHKKSFNISNLLSHKNIIYVRDYINDLDKNLLHYFHNVPAWLTSLGIPVTSSQFSTILPITIVSLPLLYLFFLPTIIAITHKSNRKLLIILFNLIVSPACLMIPWIFTLYLSLG